MSILGRLRGKDPRIVAWRGWRELTVRARTASGGWRRRDAGLRSLWTGARTAAWWQDLVRRPVLLAPGGAQITREWSVDAPGWRSALAERARRLGEARVDVFDGPVEWGGMPPWLTDWRYGHEWPAAPYHSFQHYTIDKAVPYDIKWPWELSRLGYLPDLMQAAAVADDPAPQRLALALLGSWDLANPIAHSANWAPMECSMRLLSLALAGEMLATTPLVDPADARLIPVLIASHAEWIEWVAERATVNGNHFDANLAALAVAGELLDGWHPRAERWRSCATRFAAPEVLRQFDPDGVNFERATGYHRLVMELFLLTEVAWRRRGRTLGPAALARLAAAARFAHAMQRPDGWLPAIGDNDSARVLSFDGRHTRDSGELLALASQLFSDQALAPPPGEYGILSWLFGEPGSVVTPQSSGAWAFPDGGVVVVRSGDHQLIVEAGEVGMRGRGGHGHNDILSFEWVVAGHSVLIDPGTLTYTGDRADYDAFRSAHAHNTVTVDGAEPAELLGPWRIADSARPVEFVWAFGHESDEVVAAHDGYCRFPDPVRLRRTWQFVRASGALTVTDETDGAGPHLVERRFQFAPEWALHLESNGAVATRQGVTVRVCWAQGVRGELRTGRVAASYGREEAAPLLVLAARMEGPRSWVTRFVPDVGPSHAL